MASKKLKTDGHTNDIAIKTGKRIFHVIKMVQQMIQIRKNKELSKAVAGIIEARKNPGFKQFIKEFVRYHTS
jgi:uncharacterized protein (UPF0264 family)